MHSYFHQQSNFSFENSDYPEGASKVHHDERRIHLNRHPRKNQSQVCFDPRQANPVHKLAKGGRKKLPATYGHNTNLVFTPEQCLDSSHSDHSTNPTYLHTFSFNDSNQAPQQKTEKNNFSSELSQSAPFGVNYGETETIQPQAAVRIAELPPPPYATQDVQSNKINGGTVISASSSAGEAPIVAHQKQDETMR